MVGFLSILSSMDRRTFPWAVFLVFLLAITLPYLLARTASDTDTCFNGFLMNPSDGYSYLAKIEQGRNGSWLFQLPFTSNPNTGAPLFLYYLFLGHVSRLFGLSALAVIHIARVFNAIILFIVLWICTHYFSRKSHQMKIAALMLGGGMGWLILPWVSTPSDFWVAEGYPFLASFTNPHFPLAIALIAAMMILWKNSNLRCRLGIFLLGGVLLSIIQPFGVVIVALTLGLDWVFHLIRNKEISRTKAANLLAFCVGGVPYSIYLLIIIYSDPVLAEWNRQNVTPSPAFIDLFLSFSPGLLVILIGAFYAIKKKIVLDYVLVFWSIFTIGLSFIPFNLQRRFLLSGYIPVTLLALNILDLYSGRFSRIVSLVRNAFLPVVVLTPVLILIISYTGISTNNSQIYIDSCKDISNGASWLKQNAQQKSTVLSDAQTGLYLPAMADVRVVYGHPFETPKADERKNKVDQCFLNGNIEVCNQLISTENIDFVWLNQRNTDELLEYFGMFRKVFSSVSVNIYAID